MKRRTARISEEAYKLLLAKKESTGKLIIDLASEYVSIGVSYDLQDEGWEERIKKKLEDLDAESEIERAKIQKKQILVSDRIGEDRCNGLVKREIPGKKKEVLKVIYICVKGSSTGTVKLKKLGVDPTKICEACKKTMNLEARWAQIRAKDKLGVEEHTYCKDGGWYDDESGRIHCKHRNEWQDQDKCFTMWNGKPCPSLKTLPARKVKRTGIRRHKR